MMKLTDALVDRVHDNLIERFAALRTAFEVAGIHFITENGDGAGVRLRKGQT